MSMEQMGVDSSHTISPDASIYSPGTIGLPDGFDDGSKLNVVAELAMPSKPGSDGNFDDFQSIVVVSKQWPDGKVAYAVGGLIPDEQGGMKSAPDANPVFLSHVDQISASIGRGGDKAENPAGIVPSNRLWGETGRYGDTVSNVHVRLNLNPDNTLTIETPGRNGTWGTVGKPDQLKSGQVETPVKSPEEVTHPETMKERRRRELFTPIEEYQSGHGQLSEEEIRESIRILWASDEEQADYHAKREAEKADPNNVMPVTEQTRKDAEATLRTVLRSSHIDFASELNNYGYKGNLTDIPTLVDAIRTDNATRQAFGNVLMDRVESMAQREGYLPERVERNTGKSPTKKLTNLNGTTSQEYVVLLGLAKLDGSFDKSQLRSTDVPDKYNMNAQGQHNGAADILLGMG